MQVFLNNSITTKSYKGAQNLSSAIIHTAPSAYNVKTVFIFPEEKDQLLQALKQSIRLILPTHENGLKNLKTLIKGVFGNTDFIEDVITFLHGIFAGLN